MRLSALLRRRNGPLTRELERTRGGFSLGQVPARRRPDATTTSVCGFCSTGCGLEIHLERGAAVSLSPARDYPVNLGHACPKGWEALTPLRARDRATVPLVRRRKDGPLEPTSWGDAVETFVRRVRTIQTEHGPESVAFLSTGQIPTEEMALLGALAKFGMGMMHGDGNTRQCMATSVVAYKEAFGFDAPPYTYADLEESDVIFLVGSNLCIAHPILWQRVLANPHGPTIVVVDPRATETAMCATEHVALRPKSDLALFYGIAHVLIARGHVDRAFMDAHTTGFEAFAEHVSAFDPARVAEATGIAAERIERLAEIIHRGRRVSFWWTMGVNQSHQGVRTAQALINLALVTGNVGRPGAGANSITGQCNAMGSRMFSNTTSLFCGRDFASPTDRADVARVLGIDRDRIPSRPSLAYDQILEGVLSGKIRGLWIIGTNPAHSWINQADARDILGRLELCAVEDMYSGTDTAEQADIFFPAAAWGEKEGTFINSERRIGLVKKVARAPGQALADFHVFKLVAEAWGVGRMLSRFESPEATFDVLRELSRGRPCDITGIDGWDAIERLRGVQWPCPEGTAVERGGERRLFEDGSFFTDDGRARFVFGEPRPLPEPAGGSYPLTLLTGRGSSASWHTETRTRSSPLLSALSASEPYVEVHPDDAAQSRVRANEWVIVESRRGRLRARAFVTRVVRPGEVFIPMHFAQTNQLTFAAFDPWSRQPAYKACAVRILPS